MESHKLTRALHVVLLACAVFRWSTAQDSCSSDGDLRLVGGTLVYEGRVEVCRNSVWGTVCDDSWGTNDATVVCRQLGHATTGAIARSFAFYGQGTGPIHMDDVHCTGSEQRLINCLHSPIDNCGHYEDAGVTCSGLCENGTLRLVGGATSVQGRVEVCIGGTSWGTVCDDEWDSNDATVVCRQLGLITQGAVAHGSAAFGQGTGSIVLDNVACTGSETTLLSCPSNGLNIHNCGHSEDAGVSCAETCSTTGAVRLIGGTSNQGRVEYCSGGYWGTVCDDSWDNNDARVVCRQLGFMTTGALAHGSATFGQGGGPIHLDDVGCIGTETTLGSCTHLTTHNCGKHEDAGVTCPGDCINGALRLVGGSNITEGRVEICTGGIWGTVCDDSWDTNDATVVCRQLGFATTGATAYGSAQFGQGIGPITLDDVACTGTESSLLSCTHGGVGNHNCGHYEDASVTCPGLCDDGNIRLVGGPNATEGRVEVCHQGQWGTVCDDSWDNLDAQVVCRQLGYPSNGAFACTNACFGQGTGEIVLDDVGCVGTESKLTSCSHSGLGIDNCGHYEDAGVYCPTGCPNGDIRLVGGNVPHEGRVEVCVNGVWGTVCDDLWGSPDAEVVCRQLGYPTLGATAFSNAQFGQGTGPIFLDNVNCAGTESNLMSCGHNGVGIEDCNHNEDASVRCVPEGSCIGEGTVRLTNGVNGTQGNVEVCSNGYWGAVCDNSWDSNDARVVCRQLGYSPEGAVARSGGYFGPVNRTILFSNSQCSGNEYALVACYSDSTHSCTSNQQAGVECPVTTCVHDTIRLVDGSNVTEGRVEICKNGVWGTVCDDIWDSPDALVVCRELGYAYEDAVARRLAFFGQGTGPIHLDDVRCDGPEPTLASCNALTTHNCGHYEDSSVTCKGYCDEGKVYLVGGGGPLSGRVEICTNGRRGTVCDDQWDNNDAQVVCRQLGYSATGAMAFTNAHFGQGVGAIVLDDTQCVGTETNLADCPSSTTHNCQHSEDAGVSCQEACDNYGDVRLVGGSSVKEGRVEICDGAIWGTVCDDSWDSNDAQVVCRQLGYVTEGAMARTSAFYGQGTGPITFDDVACTGSESLLHNCTRGASHNCLHSEDAGVVCQAICLDGTVRLVGGISDSQGRVEVCLNDQWGTVCDDFWGTQDAQVVCRQLGYSTIGATSHSYALFGQGSGPILMDNVQCSGNEPNITSCTHLTNHNCGHYEDAGVTCYVPCSPDGAIRLVGGANSTEGRVEICQGVWGTVCDDQWGNEEARVACRHAGFGTNGAIAYGNAHFGQGTGPILADDFECTGSESILTQCPYNSEDNCGHYEDAGVKCPGPPPQGEVRIVNGTTYQRGRVEIYFGQSWGTLCGAAWGIEEAQVACRELGVPIVTGSVAYGEAVFGQGSGIVYTANCVGNETNLAQCAITPAQSCGHNQDAGVACPEPCNDDDEGELRLISGSNQTEGTVEICFRGVWGTICDEQWGTLDAQVVCRQLGYVAQGAVARSGAFFAQGTGPVHLTNFQCLGPESNLQDCTSIANTVCDHNRDVGVTCPGICQEDGLRLVGGSAPTQGRVEICRGQVWGTVCDDFWGTPDANVVCRQLGYAPTGATSHRFAAFGQGSGPIFLDNVHCSGNEQNLTACPHTTNHNCDHYEDAGVTCLERCEPEGAVRLIGPSSAWGRVEVCRGQVWGTVCDDLWGIEDSSVVCRQLGFNPNGTFARGSAYYGEGTGPIQMDDVGCNGDESFLVNCTHNTNNNCGHGEDAGVECPVPPSRPRACIAEASSSTGISVRWLAPREQNGDIMNYRVTYTVTSSLGCVDYGVSSRQPAVVNTQTDGLQLVLANLLKATQYNFSIVAENAVGPSQPSIGPCVATTQEDVPTGRPLSPMTQSGECTSMNVSWLPPNTGDQNGVITKYRLYYTTNNSLPLSQRTYMTMNVGRCTDRPNVKLTNLKAESQYFIAISAGTSLGFGPIVNVSGFPSSRPPNSVPSMAVTSTGSTSVTLTLTRPSSMNGRISHYQIAVVHLPTRVIPSQSPDVLFPHRNSFLHYTEVNRISSRPTAYIAAEFSADIFPANGQFVIGNREQPNDKASLYTNAPLDPGRNYTFFVRVFSIDCISDQRQYNLFTSSNYSTPTQIPIPESIFGGLPNSAGIAIIVVAVVLIVISALLVIFAIVYVKLRKDQHDKEVTEDKVRFDALSGHVTATAINDGDKTNLTAADELSYNAAEY